VPEPLVLERLKLTARRPELTPVNRLAVAAASRKLLEAEKQVIQALVQKNQRVADAIQPIRNDEFWREVWSWPVVMRLLDTAGDIEKALSDLGDEQLAGEVRAAVIEDSGTMTAEYAMSSIYKLYDEHLKKKQSEIQEQLQGYGAEAAPRELLTSLSEILSVRNRIRKGVPNS
jgi:hypothetical protein